MFVFGSSASSSISLEINLLKWSECDTIGKKIGYIAGSAINSFVSTSFNLADKTIKLLHLDEILRFVTAKVKLVISKIIQNVQPIAKNIFTESLYLKLFQIFKKCLTSSQKILKTLADWSIIPLYNHVLLPLKNQIDKVVNAISLNCNFKNKAQMESQPVDTRCNALFVQIMEKVKQWVMVPLFKHVIKPVADIASDICHGIFSGCFTPKEVVKKEKEKETEKVN